MKKLISFFLVLFALTAHAQNFEGTIKWSMKMDLDPATKAKMDDAQKKMKDPATQAQMKLMQDKMNDPQMKAMMDANPQMKAQMESAMKMIQGGSIGDMIPKGFTIRLKGQNILTTMDGGVMAMEILYLKDKDQAYQLDRQNKTYSPMMTGNRPVQASSSTAPKVTKTSETAKILNYTCTKYLVDITEGDRTIHQSIWATTEIKDIDLKGLAKQRMGRGQSFFHEGIDGFPLRVASNMTEGNVTMEVTEIKKESLNAADFSLPADFKETQGMFGK